MGASLTTTKQWFEDNGSALSAAAIGISVLGGAYYFYMRSFRPPPPPSFDPTPIKKATSFVTIGIIVLFLVGAIYLAYAAAVDQTASSNLASSPVVSSTTITSSAAPSSDGKWGLMFWIYVKDWDKNFGKTKSVIVRSDGSNHNPKITLESNDNNMEVEISVYPLTSDTTTPANNTGGATDTTHKLKIHNIPLQKWTSVCMSLSGRSLDVYIDGELTRSTFLSGVPRPVTSDLVLMGGDTFSGSLMDVFHYSRSLIPADARAFHAAGTSGEKYTNTTVPSNGYRLKIGLYDANGKAVTSFMS